MKSSLSLLLVLTGFGLLAVGGSGCAREELKRPTQYQGGQYYGDAVHEGASAAQGAR